MLKNILFSIIIIGTDKVNLTEKLQFYFKLILTFSPVAYFLDGIHVWFLNNQQFFSFMIVNLAINMIVGGVKHKKEKTFDWANFWKSNIKMWFIILTTYPLLEMISIIAGENQIGLFFKTSLQLSTFLYPFSKTVKNIYLWSEKKYPPYWFMEKLYNFEKTGNLKDFEIKDKDKENAN